MEGDKGSLTLGRKVGQTIRIGKDVVIRLVEVRGNRARIQIEAPLSVSILRGELDRIADRGRTGLTGEGIPPYFQQEHEP